LKWGIDDESNLEDVISATTKLPTYEQHAFLLSIKDMKKESPNFNKERFDIFWDNIVKWWFKNNK